MLFFFSCDLYHAAWVLPTHQNSQVLFWERTKEYLIPGYGTTSMDTLGLPNSYGRLGRKRCRGGWIGKKSRLAW